MKILMLNPPFFEKFSRSSRSPAISKGGTLYYPIWLAYATGVLEEAGHKVKLVDAPAKGMDKQEALQTTKQFEPELAVLDTSTPSIYSDVVMAGAIKEALPNAFVTLVGTHPSALPEETLKLGEGIDAVTRREYDYTLRDLARCLEAGRGLSSVKGLSFREDGKIVHNQDREYITDLDALPFVSKVYKRHLDIQNYFYAANLHPVITIISGRGCPFRCTYCLLPQTLNGRGYRFRSPENFVDELEYIKAEFPEVKEVFIEDDTLTANRKRCRQISDLIVKRKLRISWSANSRADVDLQTLKSMKRAGCRLLCVGFESGSQKILDNIHKGTKIAKIRQFMRDVKKADILVHGCFMLGCPGETKETVRKTVEFGKELAPDTAQFFPIMVYPGTEAYEWAKKEGYLLTEDYSKWLTEEGVHNCLVSRPELSNDDLVALCDEARKEFYLRPSYISGKLKQMATHPGEIRRTLKSGRTFLKYLLGGSRKKAREEK